MREVIKALSAGQRSVLVVGLGVTGIESAIFLHRCGIKVICVERALESEFRSESKYSTRLEELTSRGIPLHFGVDGEGVVPHLSGIGVALLSPGVSLESALVGALRLRKVPYLSELELGIELSGLPSLVVSGSNGKTTTVSLLQHILNGAGLRSLLCGNVGTPVLSELTAEDVKRGRSDRFDCLAVEASSYQLEACEVIKPKVAAFLNLSENHLERHGSMNRYLEAKARMFRNQDSTDFAVLNGDDARVVGLLTQIKATPVMFGKEGIGARFGVEFVYNPARNVDSIKFELPTGQGSLNILGCGLIGVHNRYNIAAAAAISLLMGVTVQQVEKGIRTFAPLEHRIELLGEIGGRFFINDSKSTTVASSLAAVRAIAEAFPKKPLVLMLGGKAKAGSWEPLMKELLTPTLGLRQVVCFGGDAKLLTEQCKAAGVLYSKAASLGEGVEIASKVSMPGDIVLLSPGCASFDEFNDFEERGRAFKVLVSGIQKAA